MVTRFISHIYYIVSPRLKAELFFKTWLFTDCTQSYSYPAPTNSLSYQASPLSLGLQSPGSSLASFGPASQR